MGVNSKIIAFYLPQFHEVKENNEWWGEGFTDWVNVKKASGVYPGHYQPRVPLNNNYYDLLEKKTMEWQAELAKQYGIYGFCMYHYWFTGKQILEKPAENLLRWKDINIPFCFSWANETWKRSWETSSGNAWNYVDDEENKNSSKGILLEQKYGVEKDWEDHFMYLCQFFSDERYIKKDNCPVFLIYRPGDVENIVEMLSLWNKMAVKAGFNGMYFVGTNVSVDDYKLRSVFDACVMYEPQFTLWYDTPKNYHKRNCRLERKNKKKPRFYSYKSFLNRILYRKYDNMKPYYRGAFIGYDNTARYGKMADIFYGNTPDRFGKQLSKLIEISQRQNQEYIFLTAWNEWGEGAYIEPDTKYKYQYLEEVKKSLVRNQNCDNLRYVNNKYKISNEHSKKMLQFYNIMDKWMELLESNKVFDNYFVENGWNKVAIYGLKELGMHLYNQLINSSVDVKFVIDKNSEELKNLCVPVYSPDSELPDVDVIVVTAPFYYKEIYAVLRKKTECRIISIEDILYRI